MFPIQIDLVTSGENSWWIRSVGIAQLSSAHLHEMLPHYKLCRSNKPGQESSLLEFFYSVLPANLALHLDDDPPSIS